VRRRECLHGIGVGFENVGTAQTDKSATAIEILKCLRRECALQ